MDSMKIDNETAYDLKTLCKIMKKEGNNVSVNMLKRYIKNGDLKATKINKEYWVKEKDIDWNIDAGPLSYVHIDGSYENENQGVDQNIDQQSIAVFGEKDFYFDDDEEGDEEEEEEEEEDSDQEDNEDE